LLHINNKSLGLKTVTNQGPMQSRESGCFHYITYLSINLESVSSLFKILYRKLSLEGRGVVVLIFLSWCISFWKKRDKMWELKNQFYRVEKEDISSIRLMMPKLRTPSKQQCRIKKVLSRPLVKGTLTGNLTENM